MTRNDPPRLALSLLSRWLPDDPLTGDLVEEFAAGRNRLWFWRQTLSALGAAVDRPRVGVRPLKLVAGPGRIDPDPTPRWPASSPCLPRRWNCARSWSSFARWKPACASTSSRWTPCR
jgi:hypothetical protein